MVLSDSEFGGGAGTRLELFQPDVRWRELRKLLRCLDHGGDQLLTCVSTP